MNNKKVLITVFSIAAIIIIILGIYQYIGLRKSSADSLPSKTIINGIDCSGLTVNEAVNKLTVTWNQNQFIITDAAQPMLTITALDFTYDITDKIEKIQERSAKYPFMTRLWGWNKKLKVSMVPSTITENFANQIGTLTIFDENNSVKSANAYLDMSNTEFKIIPESYGTNIDRTVFQRKILELISKGIWELEYNNKDFYVIPTVKSDDPELLKKQKYAKKYLSYIITYDFGDTTKVISPAELDSMVTYDGDGTASVNNEAVTDFVSLLASTYNTAGKSTTFQSTSRGKVTIAGGTYGYSINKSAEISRLTNELTARESITREPEYSQRGKARYNGGFGNTYVEIDIANQHLWYYKNGQVILSTAVVTGSVSGRTTTVRGAYSILYKDHKATLKGRNADGTDYESDVDYWMPFYKGYGLHDAPWRSAFGGQIYLTGGSHGCVNMPVSSASTLFYNVSPGCPVIVF